MIKVRYRTELNLKTDWDMKKYIVFDSRNIEVGRFESELDVIQGLRLPIKSTDYVRLASRGVIKRLNGYKIVSVETSNL